ncbi:hypothetical protein ACCI51_18935 [Microbulbifer echini]|uniref:Uncharacterized protein n=1 Tax=Microbulbifer echini TaxID=1529067 RepID=A0ABV4NUC0_9GAMM
MFKYGLTALLIFALASCDKSAEISRDDTLSPHIVSDGVQEDFVTHQDNPLELDGPNDTAESDALVEQAVAESTAVAAGGEGEPTQSVSRKPIDISAAFDEESVSGDGYDFSRKDTLPDLFDPKEKENGVSFKGKLINDPANPDYFDSVEGAEFSVEVKTR